MKKHALLLFFILVFSTLSAQNVTLNFISANPSDIIDSILVKQITSGDSVTLNGTNYSWDGTAGLLYHFEVYSGDNTTIIADTPQESKEYIVEFHKCQDKDGRNYKIVQIGDQWWMAENLAYLPDVTFPPDMSRFAPRFYIYGYRGNDISEALDSENYQKYGVLYNWNAAQQSCPEGWHLPASTEWEKLANFVNEIKGPYQKGVTDWYEIGKHLKSNEGWIFQGNGKDDFGLSMLPGGLLWGISADFFSIDFECRFWAVDGTGTTDDANQLETYYFNLYYLFDTFFKNQSYREGAYSVRCIKN